MNNQEKLFIAKQAGALEALLRAGGRFVGRNPGKSLAAATGAGAGAGIVGTGLGLSGDNAIKDYLFGHDGALLDLTRETYRRQSGREGPNVGSNYAAFDPDAWPEEEQGKYGSGHRWLTDLLNRGDPKYNPPW